MISFSIHFLYCNLFISLILVALLLIKRFLGKYLSGCSQYRIWFLLPVLFAVPFLSIRPSGFSKMIYWFSLIKNVFVPGTDTADTFTVSNPLPSADWINDLQLSVTRATAPAASSIPFVLWTGGMLLITIFMIKSRIRLYRIERSSLPLQSREVELIYETCRSDMKISRNIPIFCTVFLKSPVIVGLFRPRIFMPVHLISDLTDNSGRRICPNRSAYPEANEKTAGYRFNETDIRYMLLHELQHYKHKDAFWNCLMNLAFIIYWFNPVVWLIGKEVKTDREIACDTFVLQMLDADDYVHYGNTLLNFAQKISLFPFSLAAGIGGSKQQIRKRILNIAQYQPKPWQLRIREGILIAVLAALILESTAWIPVLGADTDASLPKDAIVHTDDLSDYFSGYNGCFVLYNANADTWTIYNETLAATRFSPNSTYKIYSALFALEHRVITPDASTLAWDGNSSSYPEWNRDQNLASAMRNSVNWYFQALDQQADLDSLKRFYQAIGYGNYDVSGGISEFWLESSLKISALEQVELLKKLYDNDFQFAPGNVQAVKDSLKLSVSGSSVLSGKTGTGIINGERINGWFIGYVESGANTWFFAANIQGSSHADSMAASEITQAILADKHIFNGF